MAKSAKITQGVVSREEAFKLAPDYVQYAEHKGEWFDLLFDKIMPEFENLKRGQKVLTCINGLYVICKVSNIKSNCYEAVDGPVVRVSNGEYSWRVDGSGYAYPIKE